MGFYVTIQNNSGSKTIFAAGPFNRHGDALRCVGHVRRHVHEVYRNDRNLQWAGFGTSRVKSGPMPNGRFNEALGLPAGRIAESPLPANWWWVEGQLPELPIRAPQRRPLRRTA
jgi:hypothetical protein